MTGTRRKASQTKALSLERLEPRILLDAVNPGELALLYGGDQLFFVQGETDEEDSPPSDIGGELQEDWIIIATYEGPGYVQFYSSAGLPYLSNGDKIGDLWLFGASEASNLFVQTGEFLEDYGLGDIPDPLTDAPDIWTAARDITVPPGEFDTNVVPPTTATYNSGRAIVAASGAVSPDWFTFEAEEAEQISVASTGPNVNIWIQYGTGAIVFGGVNSYTILDDNASSALDAVNVYLEVANTGGLPYTLIVDRIEQNVGDWDADGNPEKMTTFEDFPESLDVAMDITYDPANETGFGPVTPEFNFFGEGPGTSAQDFFLFSMGPGATIYGSSFMGTSAVLILDASGMFLSDLMWTGEYTNTGTDDLDVVMDVVSYANWNFDLYMRPMDLSNMVELVTDNDTGRYIWGNADSTPWMDSYTPPGEDDPVHVPAPDGSGGVVITRDVYFDSSSTGFGTFAVDGPLKGSVGVAGFGLDAGETIREIRVGYIHNQQSDFQGLTVGGTYIEGNVDRLAVKTTVAEVDDDGVNRAGNTDLWGAANIYVGGHLIEFQASGTVFANMTVLGNSTTEPTFDADLRVQTGEADFPHIGYGEMYSGSAAGGFINDTPDSAYIVGSPTGSFAIEGYLYWSFMAVPEPWDKWDGQDWYVVNFGLGEEVTVTMTVTMVIGLWEPTWIFSPSGRVVAPVTPDDPHTFIADEGGNYYLMVGHRDAPQRLVDAEFAMYYRISVSGARPVALGGVVAGSDLFGSASTAPEFADDMSDVWFNVGSVGFLEARNDGIFADVKLTGTGHLGYVSGASAATDDNDYMQFSIAGNLDRLETRTGDIQFNFIEVGGNLGELDSAGLLGDSLYSNPITVWGHVGSVVVADGFFAQMSVYQDGLDLLYVGGDFGSPLVYSRLDTAQGADVAFAYVGGDIYYDGLTVFPVTVVGETAFFTDDGGSHISLTPVSTRPSSINIIGQRVSLPSALTYRYLPVGRPGGGPVGAVLTEIISNDALEISIDSGRADLPYVRFGNVFVPGQPATYPSPNCYLSLDSADPLGELDVYFVDVIGGLGSISHIENNTQQGDILNVSAASVGRIFADGHIGLTERFAREAGQLQNPTPALFSPPAVLYVFDDPSLSGATAGAHTEQRGRYFNGVVASGSVGRIEANGSIGDVYVGGFIGTARADADEQHSGTEFIFRGKHRDARSWDGVAGAVYAVYGIDFIDPGDGIWAGHGSTPAGGIFTAGQITKLSAEVSVIEGPVFGALGIGLIRGVETVLHEATIGAGADFSDWTFWDEMRVTTLGVRLDNLLLSGVGSAIDSSMIQVGVLGTLSVGRGGGGFVDSQIWAVGDLSTGEGINTISILGGNMDGTGAPPYSGLGQIDSVGRLMDIISNTRIGTVTVRDGDMINMDFMSLGSLDSISVGNDIVYDTFTAISAPRGIGSIEADNITGMGELYVGTGRLDRLLTRGNFEADVHVDGAVGLMRVSGSFTGDLTTSGPNGNLEHLILGDGLSGNLFIGNYIGIIDVLRGDIESAAAIYAGGSNEENQAIGTIKVRRGDLASDITITVNLDTLRPGGGIGEILVNGNILGDITTTSYYDPVRGNPVTAHIGTIKVMGGNLDANVTTQRNAPADPNDPGGDLGSLIIINGDLILYRAVTVRGNLGEVSVKGGVINGAITVLGGSVDKITVVADGRPPVSSAISIDGDLGQFKVSGGDFTGSLTVGGTLDKFWTTGELLGPVHTGEIGRLYALAGTGAGAAITATGDAGLIEVRGGDLVGAVSVGGDLGKLRVTSGQLIDNGTPEPGIDIGGSVNLLQIYDKGGAAVGDDVVVGDHADRILVKGDVAGDITVGDGVGQFNLRGDLGGDFTVVGDVGRMLVREGQVVSNDDPADPRIDVSGDLDWLKVDNYAGEGPIIDDDVYVGDVLSYFQVRGGDFAGSLQAGFIGTALYYTPNGVTHSITSNSDLDLLKVSAGPIAADVEVFHHIGRIQALGGVTADGSITVGESGFPGAGLDQLLVKGGNLEGNVNVTGSLSRVKVNSNVAGSQFTVTGDLGQLSVRGDLLETDIAVTGELRDVLVRGNYTDSNINAGTLGKVTVRGQVSSLTPPDDVIHASTGRFDLYVSGMRYHINDAEAWFDDDEVHAYVG